MNVFSEARPRKPENADSEADASNYNGREPPLWYRDVVVRGEFAVVARREGYHEDGGEELAYGVRIDLMLSVTIYLPPIMPRNGNYDWALVNAAKTQP
jgi:hypothetical protein